MGHSTDPRSLGAMKAVPVTYLDMDTAKQRPLLGRPMILLLLTSFGSLACFYLLVSVVPLYVATGGSGRTGAGLSTSTMMLSTVLTEFAVPGLLSRYGYRVGMAWGLFLLGAPSAALAVSPALPLVLTTCLARGAGLGIVVVAGPALVAELVPTTRRNEALGLYGVAVGIPAVVGLPLGLWLSVRFGYGTVSLLRWPYRWSLWLWWPACPLREDRSNSRPESWTGSVTVGSADRS